MFERFNLQISHKQLEELYVNGNSITEYKKKFQIDKKELLNNVSKHFLEEIHINGDNIVNEWFPTNKWDIFISHSHVDEEMAIHLAAWFNRKFKLNVFIDSFVWGSADELLRIIDKKYCVLSKNGDDITYDYDKRNFSTSHVHMMLSVALSDIIDKTECIIFLNTPNSLNINDINIKKTNSPWIYNEIKLSSIIARKYPRRIDFILEHFEKTNRSTFGKLQIDYDISKSLNEFNKLDYEDLLYLEENFKQGSIHPLDLLYSQIIRNNG